MTDSKHSPSYIVGITGGSASGKTSFIEKLKPDFKDNELCVISQDHYYRPFSEQKRDADGIVNFDLPQAVDFKRLLKDLVMLKKGKTIELIEYTFNNSNKFPQKLIFQPTPVIILEGLFILNFTKLAAMLDLKIFIDANEDLKLSRRLKRDVKERGMNRKEILYQWEHHVKPSFDRYLLPVKQKVDMIILNNTKPTSSGLENSRQMLVNHLKSKIK